MEKTPGEIRAFIAIELSLDIAKKLDMVSQHLKEQIGNPSVRWVPARNIHLTLKFLGDVPVDNLGRIKDVLTLEASQVPVFDITIGSLGAFPSIKKPRVLWVGVQAPGELNQLFKGIEKGVHSLGFAREERPFSAHLTVGRVSKNANSTDLRKIDQVLTDTQVGKLGVSRVDKVNLYKSDLKTTGAVYTCLYSAPLLASG